MTLCMTLFLTFARIGLFTFGGGYAMIAIIEHICVDQKKWITHDEMMDITVIAESTPGPIAINCATFVGYKQKGIPGAVLATLGMVLPSFVIITLISGVLGSLLEIPWVSHAFKGIGIAVGILILDAAVRMLRKQKKAKKQPGDLFCRIMPLAFVLTILIELFKLPFSSIGLMLLAAAVGLIAHSLQTARGVRKEAEK